MYEIKQTLNQETKTINTALVQVKEYKSEEERKRRQAEEEEKKRKMEIENAPRKARQDAEKAIRKAQQGAGEAIRKAQQEAEQSALIVDQERKKQEEAKRKAKRKMYIGATVLVAVLIITVTIIIGSTSKANKKKQIEKYEEAITLMSNKQWEDAFKAFLSLGDYEDSQRYAASAKENIDKENKIQEEKQRVYDEAIREYEAGNYEEALSAFLDLVGFLESSVYVEKCKTEINNLKYSEAKTLYDAAKYEEAKSLFAALGNYKDSKSVRYAVEF